MKKYFFVSLFMIGLALIIAVGSTLLFPEWRNSVSGWLALLGLALIAVATFGGGLKDWRDIFFPDRNSHPKRRTQEMEESEEGEQTMRGQGGIQKQKMTKSPRGKQKMD